MTHNLSFRYHAHIALHMTTKSLGLGSTKVEVLHTVSLGNKILLQHCSPRNEIWIHWSKSNCWIYFYIVLNKNKNLLVRTKFYWNWAGGMVLIVRTALCQTSGTDFKDDISFVWTVLHIAAIQLHVLRSKILTYHKKLDIKDQPYEY